MACGKVVEKRGSRPGQRSGEVQVGNVVVSAAAAAALRTATGGRTTVPSAAETVARAVEDASCPGSTRAVSCGDRLACFFNLALPGGALVGMRAVWSADPAGGRKTVTSVELV